MVSKPDGDDRQRDFFGAPAPAPKLPTARSPKPKPPKPPAPRPPHGREPPEEEREERGLPHRLARLSPAELRELTATLTDDALAQLTVATIRQLKRRLAREARYGNKAQRSPLKRAAEQLVAEFSGQGEEDEF